MKTKYFVLIILSLFIYKLSANEYINNFYVRDIFLGQTTLISEDFIVHGIKYEVECKGEIKIIKGYYFNSTKLKFIDTYLNNKLVNTEYFSKYEKKPEYARLWEITFKSIWEQKCNLHKNVANLFFNS